MKRFYSTIDQQKKAQYVEAIGLKLEDAYTLLQEAREVSNKYSEGFIEDQLTIALKSILPIFEILEDMSDQTE